MIRFYGLYDGKIMVRKTKFFLDFVWKKLVFFAKISARVV